jgi:hypothetical protein
VDIETHNLQFLKQKGTFRLFCAAEATVVLKVGEAHYQVCQVGFARSDGSIRVEWPYLRISQGIVGEIHFDRRTPGAKTYNLTELGKFTSQLVKLSHHTSGEVLFSKTRLVSSSIRRQSFSLTNSIGRVFELHVFHPTGYKRLNRLKPNRLYIVHDVPSNEPAVVLRGEWRAKQELARTLAPHGRLFGPRGVWEHRRFGGMEEVAFLAQPLTYPLRDHVLCMTYALDDLPKNWDDPGMILMGGFNPHYNRDAGSLSEESISSALLAMYPTYSSDDIVTRIGSIDLTPSNDAA